MSRLLQTIAVVGTALALGRSPAAADVDLTGSWLEPFLDIPIGEICHLTVTQSGTSIQLVQHCFGDVPDGIAIGTIDPSSGDFSATGTCGYFLEVPFTVPDPPYGTGFVFEGTGSADGLRIDGLQGCSLGGVILPVAATREPVCGNHVVDPGEDCEPPSPCCSATCHFDVGAACALTTCQAGACDATGACVPAAPIAAGMPCETDGDNCTVEQCDGAGACVVTQTVTCDACSVCNAAHQCDGLPRSGCMRSIGLSSRALLASSQRLVFDLGHTSFPAALVADPTTTHDYQLCVFARSTSTDPWRTVTAPRARAGTHWDRSAAGYRFLDPAATDGIATVKLSTPANPFHARVRVQGFGAALGLPADFTPLGLEPAGELEVQLRVPDGACWGARFPARTINARPQLVRAVHGF